VSDREALLRLMNRYAEESQGLAETFATRQGVHPTDLHALLAIIEHERAGNPLQPADLVTRLGRSSGSVTTALDRLESSGHIRRERDTADRRRVRLHRSDQGAALAGQFFAGLAQRADGVLDSFGDTELDTIGTFLAQIVDVMAAYRTEMTP
jgi:DNA-binding MarR family transcriptional regulator